MSLSNDTVDLIERCLEGAADGADFERLLALLERDEECRREFASALRMHGLLHAGADFDPDCERLAEVVGIAIRSGERSFDSRVMNEIQSRGLVQARRGGSSKKWIWSAIVSAACVLVTFAALFFREPPRLRLSAASAQVAVERGSEKLAARAGLVLEAGDVVLTPSKGWASLAFPDGSTVEVAADSALVIEDGSTLPRQKRLLVKSGAVAAEVTPQPDGQPLLLRSPHAEATVVGTSLALSVASDRSRLLVRHGQVAFSKRDRQSSIDVRDGQAAVAAEGRPLVAEPIGREVLQRLGKDRFMLGVMSSLGENWIEETRAQGCKFDLRYQHLSSSWTKWNAGGGFVPLYLQESDRMGVVSVFSYYAMIQSAPAKDAKLAPAAAIALNCVNRPTMKKYFTDLLLFMKKAGEYKKPLILHVEPEVWGHFLSAPEFAPHDPEKIRVIVGSTGLPELEGMEDTLVSFGRAFGLLRDRSAPNVILAWHASNRPELSARTVSDVFRKLGAWELLFTDVGDRDAAFRELRQDMGGWWSDKDFADYKAWSAELHAQTGLPLFLWRIPLGNTVMAACNNTPWHYMDNRAEYFLEDYPKNAHIAEWAAAGYAGLLFGGGTIECTVHRDNAKDGVTNPTPIKGNKGETSSFPDDDGGYLRLRAGNYYRSGPIPFSDR